MTRLRRIGTGLVMAATLAASLTVATPAMANTTQSAAASVPTIEQVCAGLADAIAFLETRPPSPLRDFLLAQAQRLFARYCQ
jgi:hypothetical protein